MNRRLFVVGVSEMANARLFVLFILFLPFLTVLSAGQSPSPAGKDRAPPDMQVLFSPGSGPGALRAAIASEIRNTRKSLDIALYTGMTAGLAREVARAAKSCAVRLVVDPDALTESLSRLDDGDDPSLNDRRSARWCAMLAEAGVRIRVMPDTRAGGAKRPIFHHKFAVIDGATALVGSYNWSARGDGLHYDNLVVLRDAAIAGRFREEFDRLWARAVDAPPADGRQATTRPRANEQRRN
jgi:phosphatidylserine/phosphatidylglycerophosphate/cardiolipin synthase-like enzyme